MNKIERFVRCLAEKKEAVCFYFFAKNKNKPTFGLQSHCFIQQLFNARGTNLSDYSKTHSYFLLYYQFIKHAFGLRYANQEATKPIFLRLFFDELPDSKVKSELFKNHIFAIQSLSIFTNSNIRIRRRDIAEIDSKAHVLLQCLDIVLGSMAFRLNDGHKAVVAETGKRGKRTIAKESLYKHIGSKIQEIYPNFNIGITTGKANGWMDIWEHRYRHWSFKPNDFTVDETKFKRGQ